MLPPHEVARPFRLRNPDDPRTLLKMFAQRFIVVCALALPLGACATLLGLEESYILGGSVADAGKREDVTYLTDGGFPPIAPVRCGKIRFEIQCHKDADLTLRPPQVAQLLDVPSGALLVVAQYEPGDTEPLVDDRVTLPHKLGLTSYKETKWELKVSEPAALTDVVLSGYNKSSVNYNGARNLTPDSARWGPGNEEEYNVFATQTFGQIPVAVGYCYRVKSIVMRDACP
jgi:hypothetical protein